MPNPVLKKNLLISYLTYLCIYDLYGPVRNVFDACRAITRAGAGGGCALEIETFLGPEMVTSEASAIWAQKSLDERSP